MTSFLVSTGCSAQTGKRLETTQPDTTFALPDILNEISGLTWSRGILLAVQDEEGDVFGIDPETGVLLYRADFASDGDFEGITESPYGVLAVRSDGRLYFVDPPPGDNGKLDAKRTRIDLHDSCDVEGAAFEPASGALLVVCKEDPGKRLGQTRAIYRISKEELADPGDRVDPTLFLNLPPPAVASEDGTMRRGIFKPSAIAVIPDRDEFLLLSSPSKTLHRINFRGEELDLWLLPGDILPQPEGLAIDPSGRVFVASEARGGTARIAVFLHLY